MIGLVLAVIVEQPDTGNNGAGFMAFGVVAALFIAGAILYRSLRHHLRKIDFDERDTGAGGPDPARGNPQL